jgi:hypothetical protein
MEFEVVLHHGVGPITFGMGPNFAREAMRVPFTSFNRTSQSAYPCDYFESAGCFVYYDANGTVEAVELANPARVILEGRNLLDESFGKLADFVLARDTDASLETDGITSVKLGLGAYAPLASEDPGSPSESVIIFRRGYYD